MLFHQDIFAFIFFLSFTIITFVFELFLVLDYVFIKQSTSDSFFFNQTWKKSFHYLLALYILHNVLGNLYKIISVDSSIKKIIMTQIQNRNLWKFCAVCETMTPPRSYHCRQCNVCILKRTHHCMFANACVGYKNFRYFFSLLIYVFIGSFYASFLNMYYVWDVLGGFSIQNFFAHAFPFLFWIIGKISFTSTLICLISIVNFCGIFFSGGLLAYHGQLLINNQTVFEKSKHIKIYDMGSITNNLKQSLGENYLLIFLSPFIPFKLLSDGLEYPKNVNYNKVTNKTK